MSLQSRLDIICDEAYGDMGQTEDVSQEASDGISTDKPVSQLDLQSLRCVSCICFAYKDSMAKKLVFIILYQCVYCCRFDQCLRGFLINSMHPP